MIKTYRVYGTVIGSKYIGEYEADSLEEASKMAEGDLDVRLCHQCSGQCEDPEINKIVVEHRKDDGTYDTLEVDM